MEVCYLLLQTNTGLKDLEKDYSNRSVKANQVGSHLLVLLELLDLGVVLRKLVEYTDNLKIADNLIDMQCFSACESFNAIRHLAVLFVNFGIRYFPIVCL